MDPPSRIRDEQVRELHMRVTMDDALSSMNDPNQATEAGDRNSADHNTVSKEGGPVVDPKQVSSRELIDCSLGQLIADINAKRNRDAVLLEDFKKALDDHCSTVYACTEAAVYSMYEQNQATIQERLQELFTVLDRIGKHEQELEDFKASLTSLYNDLQ